MAGDFLERLYEKQDDLWNDARTASPRDRLLYFSARHPRLMTYVVPVVALSAGAWLF